MLLTALLLSACQVRQGGDVEADFGPPAPTAASEAPLQAKVLRASQELNDYEVRLEWSPSKKVVLQKASPSGGDFPRISLPEKLVDSSGPGNSYIDKKVSAGSVYEYTLIERIEGEPTAFKLQVEIPTDQEIIPYRFYKQLPQEWGLHNSVATNGFLREDRLYLPGSHLAFVYDYFQSTGGELVLTDKVNESLFHVLTAINPEALPFARKAVGEQTRLALEAHRAEGRLKISQQRSDPPAIHTIRIDFAIVNGFQLEWESAGIPNPKDTTFVRLGTRRFFREQGKETEFKSQVGIYENVDAIEPEFTLISFDGIRYDITLKDNDFEISQYGLIQSPKELPGKQYKKRTDNLREWFPGEPLSALAATNAELPSLEEKLNPLGLNLVLELKRPGFSPRMGELLKYIRDRDQFAQQPLIASALRHGIRTIVFSNKVGAPRREKTRLVLGDSDESLKYDAPALYALSIKAMESPLVASE